jgi:hypothetical protein
VVEQRTLAFTAIWRWSWSSALGLAVLGQAFTISASEVAAFKQNKGLAMHAQSETAPVRDLLTLRDGAFETRRIHLFAKPGFAEELRSAAKTAEPVDAFAIRVLLQWLVEAPASFGELERFILVKEPELGKKNRTAAGNDSSTNLLREIGKQSDLSASLDYLLLRAFTRPSAQSYVYDALGRYFAQKPIHEPEVWIRMTLEINDASVTQHAAEQVLVLADKTRTLQSLRLERTQLAAQNSSLPTAFEALRTQLSGAKQ